MSHRGTKALADKHWQARMRQDGYSDGYAGRPGKYSNPYYMRAWHRGRTARVEQDGG